MAGKSAGGTPPRKRRPRKSGGELTPVQGAVIEEPAYEAHRLRLTGLPWREVAGLTGYASEITAQMAVTAYLQRAALSQSADQARIALATELDRLDALQQRWWAKALDGDAGAAHIVLKVIAQRSRLLGLEEAERRLPAATRTIVITGNPEDYVSQLRGIAEGREPEP